MKETEVAAAIQRARDRITVGPAPVSEIVQRGQRSQRNHRVAQVLVATAAVVLVLSGGVAIPRLFDGSPNPEAAGNRRSDQAKSPDVEGLTASKAYRMVRNAGLMVEWTSCGERCPAGESGKVVDQDPKAGSSIAAGSTVTLTVIGYGEARREFSPDAALIAPEKLALTLYSGSTCPEWPEKVEATGANEVTVVTDVKSRSIPRGVCTTDFRGFSRVVELPSGIDPYRAVAVTVVSPGYRAPTTVVAEPLLSPSREIKVYFVDPVVRDGEWVRFSLYCEEVSTYDTFYIGLFADRKLLNSRDK